MMKKITFLFSFLCAFYFTKAQQVWQLNQANGSNLNDTSYFQVTLHNAPYGSPTKYNYKIRTDSLVKYLQGKNVIYVDTVYRIAGKDSIFYKKNGVTYALKDSTGTGGSSFSPDSVKKYAWSLTGNTGTNASINFIGTIDKKPLLFKVNNVLMGRLDTTFRTVMWGINNTASGMKYGTISGGQNNTITISSDSSVIAGGTKNSITNTSYSSVIGGGSYNSISYSYENTISGGRNNSITSSSYHSTIGGGYGNSILNNSPNAVISGGSSNIVNTNSNSSAICGGSANYITNSTFAFLGGGNQNIISGSMRGVIGGGLLNNVYNSTYSSIGGGYLNSINSGSNFSFIGGGWNDTINNSIRSFIGCGGYNAIRGSSDSSVIVGGTFNKITGGSDGSFIGGGWRNYIQNSAIRSFLGGGDSNKIASSYSSILGGHKNTISNGSDSSVIVGGSFNLIDSTSFQSFIGGGRENYVKKLSAYSFIGGGGGNYISNTSGFSFLGGGYNNYIDNNSGFNYLGGGYNNYISNNSGFSSVVGGSNNYNDNSSYHSFIGGGYNNYNDNSSRSFIGGGSGNYNNSFFSSIIGGQSNIGNSYNVTVAGAFNDTLPVNTRDSWQPDEALFIVGNGIDDANRSNALTILKNGNIGAGTIEPEGILDIRRDSAALFVDSTGIKITTGVTGFRQIDSSYGGDVTTYHIKLSLSAAQLQSANSSPIDVGLPASGAGYYYKCTGYDINYTYGTSTYSTITSLDVKAATASAVQALNSIVAYSANSFGTAAFQSINNNLKENDTMELKAGVDDSSGDGTCDVYLTVLKIKM